MTFKLIKITKKKYFAHIIKIDKIGIKSNHFEGEKYHQIKFEICAGVPDRVRNHAQES